MAKYVEMRLCGVMQAYSPSEKYIRHRRTESMPSKAAIYGMVEAAFGIDYNDFIAKREIEKVYYIEKIIDNKDYCEILDDYQIICVDGEGVPQADGKIKKGGNFPEVFKEYLADADFTVKIGAADDDKIYELAEALQHPVYPIYLGRYNCTPSMPVFVAVHDNATG